MMYQSIPVPMRTALSGLGFCTLTSDDGTTCLVESSDVNTTYDGSGSSGSSGESNAPGPNYTDSFGNYINGATGQIITPGLRPVNAPISGSPSAGFNWGIIAPIASSFSSVFATRYAVPQLNPGQTIQTGPGGTLMTQQPAGLPATGGLLTGSTGISTSTLLLFGGVGAVVMMLMKRGK